ncbi:MAG: NusG domain II-containing protein [Clostridia bacterium]|nr:NusG domain II-containing protein [Clostridia bacterium]
MRSYKPTLFRIWDVVLIVLLLVLVGLTVYFALAPSAGESAEIYLRGEKVATLPLDKNGEWSNEHIKVVVSDGKVSVTETDCPDKLCQKSGAIDQKGASIVCLPNQVVVKIAGKGEVEVIV